MYRPDENAEVHRVYGIVAVRVSPRQRLIRQGRVDIDRDFRQQNAQAFRAFDSHVVNAGDYGGNTERAAADGRQRDIGRLERRRSARQAELDMELAERNEGVDCGQVAHPFQRDSARNGRCRIGGQGQAPQLIRAAEIIPILHEAAVGGGNRRHVQPRFYVHLRGDAIPARRDRDQIPALRRAAVVVPQLNFRVVGRKAVGKVEAAISGKRGTDAIGSVALQIKKEFLAGGPRVSVDVELNAIAAVAVRRFQRGGGRVLRLDNVGSVGYAGRVEVIGGKKPPLLT